MEKFFITLGLIVLVLSYCLFFVLGVSSLYDAVSLLTIGGLQRQGGMERFLVCEIVGIVCLVISIALCSVKVRCFNFNKNEQNNDEALNKTVGKKKLSFEIIIFSILFIGTIVWNVGTDLYSQYNPNGNVQKHILKNKTLNTLDTLVSATTMGETCNDFSSLGLAKYFSEIIHTQNVSGAKITLYTDATMEFVGDGSCTEPAGCYVIIDGNGENAPNQNDIDIIRIPIYRNDDNTIGIYQDDYDKIKEELGLPNGVDR